MTLMTNLLFFFGEEKPDIGKLAVWRLKTHLQFGGTWMSDYVNNRLGGFLHEAVAEKPDCALIGEDGNIFNLMGIAARTLRENGMKDKAEEMEKRITEGGCQHKPFNLHTVRPGYHATPCSIFKPAQIAPTSQISLSWVNYCHPCQKTGTQGHTAAHRGGC